MNQTPSKEQLYSHLWPREVFDALIERAELKPTKLHLQLTRRCTHRCVTCNHHLAEGGPLDLPPELVQELLAQGRAFGLTNLSLTGGEPTLRADLCAIVSRARELGYSTVTVATNGDRLADPERARELIQAGATHVPLSLHGLETHDEIVGARGSRERVLRAVDNLLDLTGGDGDRVSVGMAIQRQTLDQLEGVAEYARRVGCGLRLNVLDDKLFFFSEGTKTQALRPDDEAAIDRLIARCFELSAEGLLRLWPRNIIFMERYLKGLPIESPCPVGLEAFYVAFDGRILPGCWAARARADAQRHTLGEAWASPAYRDELYGAFCRRCRGCGCTFRTMSAWYMPYIVEGWLRSGELSRG